MKNLNKIVFTIVLGLAFLTFDKAKAEGMPNDSVHAGVAHNPADGNSSANNYQPINAEKAMFGFKQLAEKIVIEPISFLPVHHNGRIKPFDTFSREILLYINGSYSRLGLNPVQAYLGFVAYEHTASVELVEVRSVELRVELGFTKSQRFLSLAQLQSSALMSFVGPIMEKQKASPKSLNEHDKSVLELFQQASLLSDISSGNNLALATQFKSLLNKEMAGDAQTDDQHRTLLSAYYKSLNMDSGEQIKSAGELNSYVKSQEVPEMFKHYFGKLEHEVFYNKVQPFFWSAVLSLIFGILFFVPFFQAKLSSTVYKILFLIPLFLLVSGLIFRVYITLHAPVTNMYTTMLWVSLGVLIFSYLLLALYKKTYVAGVSLIVNGLMLMLTYQIPLILSPDMDPIVAVLRNNFWLSTHVTVITISYAAFTLAMVFGNILLIRAWFQKDLSNYVKEYSHYAYRMIQLGCFLLTVGIILGGIWADYSWGRFWGWDPKETWALIADLGFLAILHARYVGWVTPFSLLAFSPAAYLLVIMAWYGVNFILAAGLHSYGFSSGGAAAVAIFVTLQLIVIGLGFLRIKHLKPAQQQHE